MPKYLVVSADNRDVVTFETPDRDMALTSFSRHCKTVIEAGLVPITTPAEIEASINTNADFMQVKFQGQEGISHGDFIVSFATSDLPSNL